MVACGEPALRRNCREWSDKFKNGEEEERSRRPKVYEKVELEALLEKIRGKCKNLYATNNLLLKSLGIIQKQIIEGRVCTCEMMLAGHKRRGILHRSH